jgi:hypothetical protein
MWFAVTELNSAGIIHGWVIRQREDTILILPASAARSTEITVSVGHCPLSPNAS